MQEIREWFDGPLALSGAIANGGAVLAAQAMGADLAYIGSAFIATDEARASRGLQAGDRRGPAEDIVGSEPFHRRLRQLFETLDRQGRASIPTICPQGDVKTMNFDTAGRKAKAWRDIWGSGQGIGAVKAVTPVAELVARLKREYDAAKARIA